MKRSKQFYLTIIISSLIIIGFSTYYTLGGFNTLEVFVMEGKERTVIGKEYIEKYNSSDFSKKMKETRKAIDSEILKGMLTVVFLENNTIGKDSVHYFIGASLDGIKGVVRLPAGYTYKEFKTDKIFKLFITQHWLVQPVPNKIAEMMVVKSIEEATVLHPYWFELYYEDESLSIEYWAK